MTQELIQKYKEARADFIRAITQFPTEKREEVLFGEWSLKQLFTHLNGWDLFLTKAIKNLKADSKEIFPDTAEGLNETTLSNHKNSNWDDIYKEFEDSGMNLFKELENLSEEDWSKALWSNNGMSTKDFLGILTGHINDEHLPLVKKFI